MEYELLLIPGDGIGPKIVPERPRKVLDAVCSKYGHKFILLGGFVRRRFHGCAWGALTEEAVETAKASDANLMGSIGGDAKTSPWYKLEPSRRPGWPSGNP